ncbi:hypothetical protein F4779DRAFT_617762 [Xylariaceae sp. FL0662B]|nr:hypothetical protein F4779DRAFT_617762 [Xylariaceae sp. FL0662B]
MAANTKPLCLVCDTVEGKYKCPRCNLYTCSVACFREHRDNHPPMPEPADDSSSTLIGSNASNTSTDVSPAASSVAASSTEEAKADATTTKLSEITDMPEYKKLIQKYPRLEAILWNLAAATDPPTGVNGGNAKHAALPGSSAGFRRKAAQPWTKDLGYENAVNTMRQIRNSPGDDRDAIQEFCELHRLFLARKESFDTAARIRQQFAKDDADVIGSLMRDEKSAATTSKASACDEREF